MIATEYELSDIDLAAEIEDGGEMVFAVESDDISEVESAVEGILYFAREEMTLRDPVFPVAQVIDVVVEQSDVAELMATARREKVVRFFVVPVGARWWLRHLTSRPEDAVRWATL